MIYAKDQLMGRVPAAWDPMASKAPTERSRDPALEQPGHISATTAVTLDPEEVVILTDFPQWDPPLY